jgi:hypothetical protein
MDQISAGISLVLKLENWIRGTGVKNWKWETHFYPVFAKFGGK